LSLIAQGVLFIPATLRAFFPYFDSVTNTGTLGAGLFVLSIFLFITVIGSQFVKNAWEWRRNGVLLTTQMITVLGIYFLIDGLAADERGAGFLLSGLVTALTTYGIFTHTATIRELPSQPVHENNDLSSISALIHDAVKCANTN
jgi:hypothetical protein